LERVEVPHSPSRSLTSSAIVRPANVTANASGRKPVPPQTGQSMVSTNRSARWRMAALCELASVCMTCRSALENVPLYAVARGWPPRRHLPTTFGSRRPTT
jgi:hypothetical protein